MKKETATTLDDKQFIYDKAKAYSTAVDAASGETAIILAAGHGKRIKSQRSKMLHKIWGTTTVERVYNAATSAIENINTVLVVGIKAPDVIEVIGKRQRNVFAYQEEQKGTGHAVQIALDAVKPGITKGTAYIFPGDMGLIDEHTIREFRRRYIESGTDMMVLTGLYEGPIEHNSYGRIIRVKAADDSGKPSGKDNGKVIEIMEHKDILALSPDTSYTLEYHGRSYSYSRGELLGIREYNSSVYAIDYEKLLSLVYSLSSDNAQNEIYITDLIGLFNEKGFSVSASSPEHEYVVMGFNDKTVLKEMETIYRNLMYGRIKNIIEIEDPDDFFIHEDVIADIIAKDKNGPPLDIHIGKGAYIGKGVKLNYNIQLKRNVFVDGNVRFGKNVTVWEYTHLSCFPDQEFIIGDNVEILWGDIIKGNILIGENTRIESSVNMTGSNDAPLRIGKNVLIKGTSYLFGSIVEDDIHIEHSVLIRKKVAKLIKRNGEIQRIRFYLPMPSGIDAIESI